MPDNSRTTHTETSPHPDGEKEGKVNDSVGKQIGISVEANREWNTEKQKLELKPDEDMKEFKEIMERNNGQ
ncbi:hypothetical protein [Pontibacillus marinus]|uniref:Uncharacterized protein n=1 Tax=Pontibacillus marinus BH030004 = DSM 16465 TaxID=1385511 RepID=A0A0A5GC58_9BACI|nr:hypothetical protein [Pontibacillus marinus]KGX89589.1 hypothetical protein N783_05515 [Pontibacillus marinus BH030004 = DSM 16465]